MKTTPMLIVALLAVLAGVSLPAQETSLTSSPAREGKFKIEVRRLSPRVAVFYGDPWTNGIVAIATQKGIVVVDAPFSKTVAGEFRRAIQEEFKRKDFACLINTHEDMCHVDGNEAYADLPIVGHDSLYRQMMDWKADAKRPDRKIKNSERLLARTQENLRQAEPGKAEAAEFTDQENCWKLVLADQRANPVVVPPTITFDREMTLYFGDVTFRLVYYGYGHGGADIIVSVPEENIVMTGGLFYPGRVPVLGNAVGGATPQIVDNWFTVMHAILDKADGNTRFIPSHETRFMNKEQCAQQVAYLKKLWTGLCRAGAEGKTPKQVHAALPLSGFPEIADLPNETGIGTPWELRDIHQRNIRLLWKVAGKISPPTPDKTKEIK